MTRSDAIDMLRQICSYLTAGNPMWRTEPIREACEMAIEALTEKEPSADDLISRLSEIRSKYNCFDENEEPYYRALSETIRVLSQRADGDTISRQAVINRIASSEAFRAECETGYEHSKDDWIDYAENFLKDIPSAERRGKWEFIGGYGYQYRCSVCITCAEHKTRYCPNCGAKMDEVEE